MPAARTSESQKVAPAESVSGPFPHRKGQQRASQKPPWTNQAAPVGWFTARGECEPSGAYPAPTAGGTRGRTLRTALVG